MYLFLLDVWQFCSFFPEALRVRDYFYGVWSPWGSWCLQKLHEVPTFREKDQEGNALHEDTMTMGVQAKMMVGITKPCIFSSASNMAAKSQRDLSYAYAAKF